MSRLLTHDVVNDEGRVLFGASSLELCVEYITSTCQHKVCTIKTRVYDIEEEV